jgi:hypothetical protein
LGEDDEGKGQGVNGGNRMPDDAWFLVLQTQHPKLLSGTQLLSGVPKMWRDLFGEWVREVEETGAIEARTKSGLSQSQFAALLGQNGALTVENRHGERLTGWARCVSCGGKMLWISYPSPASPWLWRSGAR